MNGRRRLFSVRDGVYFFSMRCGVFYGAFCICSACILVSSLRIYCGIFHQRERASFSCICMGCHSYRSKLPTKL